MLKQFFDWYNRHLGFHIKFATILFLFQIFHLIWLTCNVVIFRLTGVAVFPHQLDWIIAAVDYTEIPALLSVSLVYVNEIFRGKATKTTWLYLLLLNTQWFHILWITDEVVLEQFAGTALVSIPIWLSWVAIFVDYLELPVMWDTIKRSLKTGKIDKPD